MAIFLIAGSCSDDDPLVETGGENEVIVTYVTNSPDTGDLINDDIWEGVEVFSLRAGLNELYTNQFGAKIIRTQAVSDNENVYLKLNWSDDTESIRPGYWTHHLEGKIWTQNGEQITTEFVDTTYDTTVVAPGDTVIDTNVVEIIDTTTIEIVDLLNPRWERSRIYYWVRISRSHHSGHSMSAGIYYPCSRAIG
jgi:hypothetical protein